MDNVVRCGPTGQVTTRTRQTLQDGTDGGRTGNRPYFRVVFLTTAIDRVNHMLWLANQVAHNKDLIDSQMRAHEVTIAANSKKLESLWLTPGTRRRLHDELAHARFMLKGLEAMKDKVSDPEIYRSDHKA